MCTLVHKDLYTLMSQFITCVYRALEVSVWSDSLHVYSLNVFSIHSTGCEEETVDIYRNF